MFRKRVVGGVIKRVSQIQNAALAEARIRELNDEINAILKVKARWEERIKQLGGPDYKAEQLKHKTLQVEGTGLEAEDGYMYFGAAKNLPQVQEIFKKEVPQAPLVNKKELLKAVDYEYLGLDEQDLELEQKEKAYEQILLKKHSKDMQNEFIQRKRQKLEQEMIGYQGENGTKKSDTVKISATTPEAFRSLFTLVLEPAKYQDQMIREAEKYKEIFANEDIETEQNSNK